MPLIESGVTAFAGHGLDQPTDFSLDLHGGANLFAELPDAESSFSGASWSADEEVLELAPYVPPVFDETAAASSSSDDVGFAFQPSPELIEMEAVAAATERIATPLYVEPVATTDDKSSVTEDQAYNTTTTIAVPVGAALAASKTTSAAAADGDMSRQTRHKRKRVVTSSNFEEDESDEFAPAYGTRKSRRTNGGQRTNRTAAKLAAIRSKTTRAAQSKLKRKAASRTMTKTEMELAGTLDLSRDELLNMTSEALEAYAQRLSSERPLTTEEQKRFKRQRRLIKNRESAQLSRLRKKAYVDELEKQIAECEEEKEGLKKKCEAQDKDLESLRSEVAQLRELLSQHPGLAQLAQNVPANARRQRLVQ